jgi:hypothetical protein
VGAALAWVEHALQVAPGVARGARCDLLGRPLGDDAAAALAALGTQVDHPVRGLDDVEVVLDHHDRVARVSQAVQHVEEQPDVVEVQARGRLVEDVQGAPVSRFESSSESFTRCASPPESVVADCPRRT